MRNYKQNTIKLLITLIAIFFGSVNVNAENCTYVEKAKLNDLASKIKTNYEVLEEDVIEEFIDPDTDDVSTFETVKVSFKISIYNITEDIYIVQHNQLTNEEITIFYKDTDNGVYTFITEDTENIIKYDYKIYSNIDSCSGEVLKSFNFTKPKMNLYAQYRMCQGLEEVSYCKLYITEDIKISESELEEKLVEYLSKEDKKETDEQDFKDVIKDNYIYVIIGVGIVVGTLGITVVIVKRRSAL